jgi:hypothetical protein
MFIFRSVLAVFASSAVLACLGLSPAHATFMIDSNPNGIALNLDKATDVGTFTGQVFTANDVSISTNVNVDTSSGAATIKPTSSSELLTTVTFTPSDPNLFDGFSSRGQFLATGMGALVFTVQDNQGDLPQTFKFDIDKANADLGPFGIIALAGSGETIKSISIFDVDGFKEAKQFTFDGVGVTPSVPEPATWAVVILGFMGIGSVGYRRRAKAALA